LLFTIAVLAAAASLAAQSGAAGSTSGGHPDLSGTWLFSIDLPPEGTFYVWASAEHLPPLIRDATAFFRAALERKVITVPGDFFDVDPGHRRGGRPSRFRRHLRFSFGPPLASLELALDRFRELITSAT
jgi:aspartate/methionine/tyrosine aminotransferase